MKLLMNGKETFEELLITFIKLTHDEYHDKKYHLFWAIATTDFYDSPDEVHQMSTKFL